MTLPSVQSEDYHWSARAVFDHGLGVSPNFLNKPTSQARKFRGQAMDTCRPQRCRLRPVYCYCIGAKLFAATYPSCLPSLATSIHPVSVFTRVTSVPGASF